MFKKKILEICKRIIIELRNWNWGCRKDDPRFKPMYKNPKVQRNSSKVVRKIAVGTFSYLWDYHIAMALYALLFLWVGSLFLR